MTHQKLVEAAKDMGPELPVVHVTERRGRPESGGDRPETTKGARCVPWALVIIRERVICVKARCFRSSRETMKREKSVCESRATRGANDRLSARRR